jgi:hypothetical protein
LNENLGPAISPVELEASMTARQKAAGPLYESALQNAPAVDTTNALATIGEHLNAAPAGSPMRRALENARTMLQQESNGGLRPVTDARTLLNARKQLDTMIEQGDPLSGLAPGAAAYEGSPLSLVRSALDKDLKSAVLGLENADQAYSAAAKGKGAIEVGRQALDGGGNAIWPEDLASRFSASPLEQQALMRAGARSDIATQLGTNRNDLGALSRTLGDEQDFNRAKMGLLFGPDPTSKVIDAVNRERAFADTAGKVTAGSRTAPMATASRAIDEATAPGEYFIPKVANVPGLLAHAGEWAIRKGAGAISGATGPQTREQLAQALIAPETERTAIVQGLLADQLARLQRGQAIGGLLSSPAVARGLLSAYGANR